MKHIQVSITANAYQQEELIALLDDFNPAGFEQTDETLLAYFEEEHFEAASISHLLAGYTYQLADVDEQNWNAVWEQNFQPVVVGDFCAVRAHFHSPVAGVAHEIIITPKMSFGTGHHATTYMMLQQMKDLDFRDKTVFDFGTGTGILAIQAEKCGAASVTAIDVDHWSIDNAQENIGHNACKNISVTLTSHLPQAQFDVVLANINRNVILDYMEPLANRVKTAGLLLLSGLLVADEPDVLEAAAAVGWTLQRRLERQGWISLLLNRK